MAALVLAKHLLLPDVLQSDPPPKLSQCWTQSMPRPRLRLSLQDRRQKDVVRARATHFDKNQKLLATLVSEHAAALAAAHRSSPEA